MATSGRNACHPQQVKLWGVLREEAEATPACSQALGRHFSISPIRITLLVLRLY